MEFKNEWDGKDFGKHQPVLLASYQPCQIAVGGIPSGSGGSLGSS